MKILHTSDWHLGKSLYGRARYREFAAFLTWLAGVLEEEKVDVLLVAGDVFDSAAPGSRAQRLYYDFLGRVSRSSCRHVVITAGNHDSPSFLSAPGRLLSALNIHVVGSAAARPPAAPDVAPNAGPDAAPNAVPDAAIDPAVLSETPGLAEACPEAALPEAGPEEDALREEILLLDDAGGRPALLVCAVPYLRDRDIRAAEAGERPEDKERKLIQGIAAHYARVGALAGRLRREIAASGRAAPPLAVMGHLFAAGASAREDDGMRDIYVGSLARVPADIFPPDLDYLALGHLHQPQALGGAEHLRYSGAPLQLGFGEAQSRKSVCLAEFPAEPAKAGPPQIRLLEVPVFQKLKRISGSLEELEARLAELALSGEEVWVEAVHEGAEYVSGLAGRLREIVRDSGVEILRVKSAQARPGLLIPSAGAENLADLNEKEVFERCLAAHGVEEGQKEALRGLYAEILLALAERDPALEPAGQGQGIVEDFGKDFGPKTETEAGPEAGADLLEESGDSSSGLK